jgi:SAM-dependent methyltransferase
VNRYTYGDSSLAGERLVLVASMFETSSASFLHTIAPTNPALAVDLGCGPGLSTRLVHTVTGAARTIGVDTSPAFVETAARDAPPGISFVAADASGAPFPVSRPDVVYARLLLAHLPEPTAVVEAWCAVLAPGGRLLIDDLESIDTDDHVFREYLDEVAVPVVRRQGGEMFVGPVVHAMAEPFGCRRVHDGVATVRPSAPTTARMFGMNLDVLVERGETPPRPHIADGLRTKAERDDVVPVVWRMRQVAFERNPAK